MLFRSLDVIRPRVQAGLKFLVLLTKSDKLSRSEAAKALSIAKLQSGGGEAMLFSALKKQGLDEVAQLLWQWSHAPAKKVKGEPVEPTMDPDQEPEPESLD